MTANRSSRLTVVIAAWCGVALLCGCVGYRIGSTLPPGIRIIHVPTFINRTSEPLLETKTTRAAIQEFQRDGSLSIGEKAKADVILEVELTGVRQDPLQYDRDRAKTVREYRLTITASVTLRNRKTGKIILKNPDVRGEYDFIPPGDLASAKRDAIPKAADDLAHDIVESVVEYW